MAIMTSIYDMMGRYTLPSVRDDSPGEHVEKFFQVYLIQKQKSQFDQLFLKFGTNKVAMLKVT